MVDLLTTSNAAPALRSPTGCQEVMSMPTRLDGLTVLTPQECLTLLRSHPVHVGRLGVTDTDGQPLIVPVNYRLVGESVIVRTEPSSLIAERAIGHRVAFQVDDFDAAWREGWSVLVQGRAEQVDDDDELERLRALPLRPWAPGERPLYLRIMPTFVTGRRID